MTVAFDDASRTSGRAGSPKANSGIAQVNTAVAKMERVLQQNAALVNDATAATEAMNVHAEAPPPIRVKPDRSASGGFHPKSLGAPHAAEIAAAADRRES